MIGIWLVACMCTAAGASLQYTHRLGGQLLGGSGLKASVFLVHQQRLGLAIGVGPGLQQDVEEGAERELAGICECENLSGKMQKAPGLAIAFFSGESF